MEQSMVNNEMRFAGRNNLNPYSNNSLNQGNFNPYDQGAQPNVFEQATNQWAMGGLLGETQRFPGAQTPSHQYGNQNQNNQDSSRLMTGLMGDYMNKNMGSKIEMSRMLRTEREDQLKNNEKMQHKFENFNKLLKGTAGKEQSQSQFQ